ncbi:MAG TPA: hypothetical protein VJL29_06770 [Thermoguttaceae bacterium]|nr:hypothetical protein [Thermoguttaceae bacterium]
MRQCPKCGKWTLEFDSYFGRFRCFNGGCGWMAPSSAERAIRLMESRQEPCEAQPVDIPQLGVRLVPSYDPHTDTFSVDFGLGEPTFDLPDPDGRMIWRIGRRTDQVAGFMLAGVRDMGLSSIALQFIVKRKEEIERRLQRIPNVLSTGRITRDVIEQVIVTGFCVQQIAITPELSEDEDRWNTITRWLEQQTASVN